MWWVGGGWWWWWVVVCKPILVFSLSLGQAEQQAGAKLGQAELKLKLELSFTQGCQLLQRKSREGLGIYTRDRIWINIFIDFLTNNHLLV